MTIVVIQGGVVTANFRDVKTIAGARAKYPHLQGKLLKVANHPEGTLFANGQFSAPPGQVQQVLVVTRLQLVRQLRVIGKWEDFKTLLATKTQVLQEDWLLYTRITQTDFQPLSLGLGLGTPQINALFTDASEL